MATILINFKTYPQVLGKKALKLAQICQKISRQTKHQLLIAPPQPSLALIAQKIKIPVYAQHTDPVKPGPHTASITPEALKSIGCQGTLLNHSEKPLPLKQIKLTLSRCQKNKLKTLVFAPNLKSLKKILTFHPPYIAYEPPQLIGGKTSVTHAQPQIIQKAVRLTRPYKTKLLCGAGIHSSQDFLTALKLGTSGIGLSSAIILAKNPEKALKELIKGR